MWGALLVMPALVPGSDLRAEEDDSKIQSTDVDTSRWLCSLCIYPIGWFGSVNFGPGYISDSSLKFGDYRGLEKKGFFLSIDGDTHYRDNNGRYFDLYAQNLAIGSRQFEMRGGQQGRYEVRLGYTEIPKYRGFGTQTPFLSVGSSQLVLPGNWVKSTLTSGMATLDQSLVDTPLKTMRKTLDAGLTLKFAGRWSYRLDFEQQKKDGTRPFGAGLFLSNTTHFPAPVDFTTKQFEMALEYAGERSRLSIGFAGSSFENGKSTVNWENPFLSGPGTEAFQADLAPDNEYYQFNLTAAFAPTPKLRLSGRAAIGRMKQDDIFLPYSINPFFSDLPLPRESLDGKISHQHAEPGWQIDSTPGTQAGPDRPDQAGRKGQQYRGRLLDTGTDRPGSDPGPAQPALQLRTGKIQAGIALAGPQRGSFDGRYRAEKCRAHPAKR